MPRNIFLPPPEEEPEEDAQWEVYEPPEGISEKEILDAVKRRTAPAEIIEEPHPRGPSLGATERFLKRNQGSEGTEGDRH